MTMKRYLNTILLLGLLFTTTLTIHAQKAEVTAPIFKDGEAQIVPAFEDATKWIRHDLWVETEFDTDGDSKPDRMHVGVTRPEQTETGDLKLPIVYVSSPYFAGVAPDIDGVFWNVKHELGEMGKERIHPEVWCA